MKTNTPTHEEIARQAREIWLARGGPSGRDAEIWLEAERELTKPASSETTRLRGEMASESEVEYQITPAVSDDEAIKAALQKREARAPQVPAKTAPHPHAPVSGKPLWSKPHSS